MEPIQKRITLLTPTLCRGADQTTPELRAPSIRGHLRWWYRALGCDPRSESDIFGGAGKESRSSKLVIRIRDKNISFETIKILPHEPRKGQGDALRAGGQFTLDLSVRRGGLDHAQEAVLTRCLDAWLLLGALGGRSTRATGSLWPDGAPETEEDYLKECRGLIADAPIKIALLDTAQNSDLRRIASDSIGGPAKSGHNAVPLEQLGFPFGNMFRPRMASPLKLRVARLDNRDRLVALWDQRLQPLEGSDAGRHRPDLRRGVEALIQKEKPLGLLLQAVLPELT